MTDFNQPVNYTQNPSRRVWFKLIESSTGQIYPTTTVTSLHIESTADIDTFRKHMHSETSALLKGILPMQLQVYGTEASLKNNQEPLSPGTQIGSFGISDKSPIIIAVPSLLAENPKKYYLYLSDNNSLLTGNQSAAYSYSQSANRIREDSGARAFIDSLWEQFKEGTKSKVFNALCVPSGTGKTQLAFALPEDQCACIYLNIAVSRFDELNRQPVYEAFAGYMVSFIRWLNEDYEREPPSGYRIYGFLYSLIKLLMKHPGLKLPVDLSRLVISDTPVTGFEVFDIGPMMVDNVRSEAEKWMKLTGRELVFFVDEFAKSSCVNEEKLAFLRRRLMNVGASVVVASTDSGALNMLNTGAATSESRDHDGPWVNLCTRLPTFVPTSRLRAKIDLCTSSAVKTILNLCVQSRPLFAKAVADKIETYLDRSLDKSFSDLLEFVEDLRDGLVEVLRTKKQAREHDGCFGYVIAMLLAGGALISGDMNQMRLFGNLTTKNWAYLVDDREVLEMTKPSASQAKRARLGYNSHAEGNDRFMRLSIQTNKPTSLHLWRQAATSGNHDDLYFPSGGRRIMFSCTTFFPDPKEDFLLYLMLAGTRNQPGLYVTTEKELFDRISMAKLLQMVFRNTPKLPSSVNDIAPSFGDHEALVCASFFSACNAGSLRGCTLEELVARFVSELITTPKTNYRKLTLVDKVPLKGDFFGQFAFPFDTELPHEVYEALNALQLSRPVKEQCVDAVTYRPDGTGTNRYQVLVEAKSTTKSEYVRTRIKDALERQDSHAKVSFIVVDKVAFKDLAFTPEKFRVLDRSEKEGNKWSKGEHLDARVFFVDIEGPNEIILQAIDGKPREATAERVIFVISRTHINSKSK